MQQESIKINSNLNENTIIKNDHREKQDININNYYKKDNSEINHNHRNIKLSKNFQINNHPPINPCIEQLNTRNNSIINNFNKNNIHHMNSIYNQNPNLINNGNLKIYNLNKNNQKSTEKFIHRENDLNQTNYNMSNTGNYSNDKNQSKEQRRFFNDNMNNLDIDNNRIENKINNNIKESELDNLKNIRGNKDNTINYVDENFFSNKLNYDNRNFKDFIDRNENKEEIDIKFSNTIDLEKSLSENLEVIE